MDASLREQFVFVMMRFKKVDYFCLSTANLQQSELAVMAGASSGCACDSEGACVSDIHQNLPVSKSAVSQTLNGLEKKGLIVRTIDPSDRRKITVTLTPEGKASLDEAKHRYETALDDILEQFGEENTKTLLEMVERLTGLFKEAETR